MSAWYEGTPSYQLLDAIRNAPAGLGELASQFGFMALRKAFMHGTIEKVDSDIYITLGGLGTLALLERGTND